MSRADDTALALAPARIHEACGPGAVAFAAIAAARLAGPVLWITPRHRLDTLAPSGLARFFDPSRLLTAHPASEIDLLWSTEESLRAGAVGLVIAEPEKPLSLTAGRRLQLAAQAGGTTGLMLIAEAAGSPAAQTRWRCAPVLDSPDSTRMAWDLIKNKNGTFRRFLVEWRDETRSVHLVSEPGERPDAAPEAP